jgi:Holliday junction resolvasome RuvABC ATP-dependent DNA helicase subunit
MIIGQEHILRELRFLLPELRDGANENILFRGPSGYGKTKLGLSCCVFIGALQSEYLIPKNGEVSLNPKFRVHFIDECHEIEEPETLYPLLDARRNTFIFATNEVAVLKEPFVNRCVQFFLREYTEDELLRIAYNRLPLSRELLLVIVNNCNGNPRILLQLCSRVERILRGGIKIETPEIMRDVIAEVLDVVDGLTEIHTRYLNFIRVAERASLDTISAAIHVDKGTIKQEIEPLLIGRGMIKISSKGRQANGI